jgi:hypothetical protein
LIAILTSFESMDSCSVPAFTGSSGDEPRFSYEKHGSIREKAGTGPHKIEIVFSISNTHA